MHELDLTATLLDERSGEVCGCGCAGWLIAWVCWVVNVRHPNGYASAVMHGFDSVVGIVWERARWR